jgi:hypothetical protein
MPNYTPHPNSVNTPSRRARKSGRNISFIKNRVAGRLQRKARKEKRDAIAESRAAEATALESAEIAE